MRATLLKTNRNYRLLFSASSISNLGDGISMVAIPWLATLLTHDPLLISAVATAQRLPWFLFSLPAGVWIDRADRRVLMARADIARLMLMACTIGLIFSMKSLPQPDGSGMSGILTLVLISFLFGSAEVIRDNAAQTMLPSLVAAEDLEQANGQMWSAEQIAGQFVGPPLAGLLLASSLTLPFGLDASIYALSALLIWLIVLPPRQAQGSTGFWTALTEGLRWMRANPDILRLALMLGAINFTFIGYLTILVLYAKEVLGLSATGYGLLLTVGALGGVIGGLVAPEIAKRLNMRICLIAALSLFVLAQALLAFFASVPLTGLAMFLEACSGMLWNVVTVSYRQRLIPDTLLGRVNSVYRFIGWGAMPFGALAAGASVAMLEPVLGRLPALHAPYMIGTVICFGLLLYAMTRLRFRG